jgi:hypothetical protein
VSGAGPLGHRSRAPGIGSLVAKGQARSGHREVGSLWVGEAGSLGQGSRILTGGGGAGSVAASTSLAVRCGVPHSGGGSGAA